MMMIVEEPSKSEGNTRAKQSHSAMAFTLVELLVVIAIIGVLVALLLPAVQAAREAARLVSCKNNLKQHGIALHMYHDAHGQFPIGVSGGSGSDHADGFGWAVALLPHLELQPLYERINPDFLPGPFKAAMSTPLKAIPGGDTELAVFRCPSSGLGPYNFAKPNDAPPYATNDYKASSGRGDAGVFYKARDGERYGYSRVRIADITDGTSNTIAFGESAYYSPDGGPSNNDPRNWPIWMGAPGGGSDEAALFKTDRFAPINCTVIIKENYLAEAIDDDCAFSWHHGGALFTFADGSVHWLSDDIQAETYWNLGTKNDEQLTTDYE
jgi:prepilin-type N-terminal cleavage/methylation domain-containing protein